MTLKPYYEHAGITIYHGDCREIEADADVLITDPFYGIEWRPRVNHRDSPGSDGPRPDLRPLLRKSNCVWGGNYFADQLPISESWLVWLKRPAVGFDDDPRTYATVEMAWTDFGGKPRVKTHVWDGGKRAGDQSNRTFCHPDQKPVEVMRWCVTRAPNGSVIDPFMGSGTTLVAAKMEQRRAIGIEIEERYCEIAAKRLSQEVMPL